VLVAVAPVAQALRRLKSPFKGASHRPSPYGDGTDASDSVQNLGYSPLGHRL